MENTTKEQYVKEVSRLKDNVVETFYRNMSKKLNPSDKNYSIYKMRHEVLKAEFIKRF